MRLEQVYPSSELRLKEFYVYRLIVMEIYWILVLSGLKVLSLSVKTVIQFWRNNRIIGAITILKLSVIEGRLLQ